MKKTTQITMIKSSFNWTITCEMQVSGETSLLTLNELLYRHEKILDLYEGDKDIGSVVELFTVLLTGLICRGREPGRSGSKTPDQVTLSSSVEGRIIFNFEANGLVYPSKIESNHIIVSGVGADRTLTELTVKLESTKMKCHPLDEGLNKLGLDKHTLKHLLDVYRDSYQGKLNTSKPGAWFFTI